MSDLSTAQPTPSQVFVQAAGPALEEVLRVVSSVAERFKEAGHELYLVGGVVRDLALGSGGDLNDIDLTTVARPKEIKSLLRDLSDSLWTQGERFGTIGAVVNGRELEITTHRAESYDPDSRKPMVVFGDDLGTDLSRRDFTINAMAYSVINRQLIDPFCGLDDLAARHLRTPDDPQISFIDDPLRMLRAARFIPRFNLSIDPALELAVRQLGHRLAIVSVERVHDELEKLFAVTNPTLGFAFLEQTGLLAQLIPDPREARADGESEDHPGLSSTIQSEEGRQLLAAAARLGACPGSVAVRRAGFVAPLGQSGIPQWLRAFRYSSADQHATSALLAGAALSLGASAASAQNVDSSIRHIVSAVGLDRALDAIQLATNLASVGAVSELFGPGNSSQVTEIAEALLRLGQLEDLTDLVSPVSGGDLITELGLKPGPMIGQAIQMLTEHRLNVGPFAPTEAYEITKQWLDQRG